MTCNNCGSQISDGSYFCKYCGTQISQNGESNKKKKGILLIGVCLVAVLLIIVFARRERLVENAETDKVVNEKSDVVAVAEKYIQNTYAFKYDSYELVEKKESEQFASLIYNLVDEREFGDRIVQIQVDYSKTGDWYLVTDNKLKTFDRWKLEGEWTYKSDTQDFWIKITDCEEKKISMEYKLQGVIHYYGTGKEICDVESIGEEAYEIKEHSEGFYFPHVELSKFQMNISLDGGLSVDGNILAKK